MFPWVNGFQWQPGHLIFLGLFFCVALGIGTTILAAARRARRDLLGGSAEEIRWKAEFSGLPPSARLCRTTEPGEQSVVCRNGFDCGSCPRCPDAKAAPDENAFPTEEVTVNGLRYPLDRGYHRGHSWVRTEPDGSLTVGLDAVARRLLGTPDRAELPAPGTLLTANGRAFELHRNGSVFRILSPISGRVLEHGEAGSEWYLRMQPERPGALGRHLLRAPDEVRRWVVRELERLQGLARYDRLGATLADGGELVEDLSKTLPVSEWDTLCGEMLLDL